MLLRLHPRQRKQGRASQAYVFERSRKGLSFGADCAFWVWKSLVSGYLASGYLVSGVSGDKTGGDWN